MRSVPASRRRALADYAGITAEIAAAILIGLMITMLVIMLFPELARGAPEGGNGWIADLTDGY